MPREDSPGWWHSRGRAGGTLFLAVEPGLPGLEVSQGEGRSEAAQTSHPGWGAQCLLAAKLRGRLEVWEQRRMVAGTAGSERRDQGSSCPILSPE